jgi:small subunit ribosomal protein S6
MAQSTQQLYEGMFLFNNAALSSDLKQAVEHVKEILDRAGAEIEAIHKWDDRRLAYPIRGQKRGLYILAYFRVAGVQIANIERDINLSEYLLRGMILKSEHMGDVELQQARDKAAQTLDAIGLSSDQDQGETQSAAPPASEPAPQQPQATEAQEPAQATATAEPSQAPAEQDDQESKNEG